MSLLGGQETLVESHNVDGGIIFSDEVGMGITLFRVSSLSVDGMFESSEQGQI